MRMTSKAGRRAGPFGAGLLAAVLILGWIPASGAQTFEPGDPIDLRGFATGTVAHVRAAEFAGTRVVNTDVAFSGAAADAGAEGLNGAQLNELSRVYQADVGNKFTYAMGTGLKVGLGQTIPQPSDDDDQIILAGKAEQDAPPDNAAPATEEIAVDGDPLAFASLARGQALARAQDSGLLPEVCVLGDDLSRGVGYAAKVQLIDTGGDDNEDGLDAALIALDDADPQRSVSQSLSRTTLVPSGQPSNFGLMTEVRQTIAPITLLQTSVPGEDEGVRALTIEVLGEWFLRAVATGQPGGARIEYGTGDIGVGEDLTSILRILDEDGPLGGLNFEDIFGEGGLQIPGDPLINISIAEGPRARTAPGEFPDPDSSPAVAGDGTAAEGAVDVLRIRLLAPATDQVLAELRVGHMEVGAQVPAGGVNCPIPVTKDADPRTINITPQEPDTSTISITVHNVFDCDLADVVLTDQIRQREGDPDFRLTGADPTPQSPPIPTDALREADVVWQLGTIEKGQTRRVTLQLQTATQGGIIRDIAEAAGRMVNCVGEDAAGLAIEGLALTGLSPAVDIAIPTPVTGARGMGTAATGGLLAALALFVANFLRRRTLTR